jgi:hypothetical protein
MNLATMAAFVCGKVRRSDAGSIAKCKEFLRQRYQVLYDESLWRDSVWAYEFTFTPNQTDKPESYAATYFLPSVVDRLLALRTTDNFMRSVAEETLYRSSIDEFAQSGTPVRFTTGAPVVAIIPEDYPYSDALFVSAAVADAGIEYSVTYIDANGDRQSISTTFGAGSQVAEDVRVLERATKLATTAAVTFQGFEAAVDIISAAAAATAWPARTPIKLIPIPTAATVFRALVKKKVLPLEDDNDVPELRGVDNALLAMAQGDMLERERQYGKAAQKHGEGLALLQDLKNRACYQEDQQMQIVPEVTEPSGQVEEWSGKNYW